MKDFKIINNKLEENNKFDFSGISQDNNRQDLINRLKDIHRKSEEKTFDLNEKFNQIKDELQKIIDTYQNDLYNTEDSSDNGIDFLSLNKYINNYINQERETSVNNINNIFEQITDGINSKIENNNEQKEEVKTSLIEIKNEFDGIIDDTLNHYEEINNKKDEIKGKIITQMNEQFGKINDIINNESEIEQKGKKDIINATQNYLENLGKKMKNEKIEM